jgi:hypothetical protein
LHDPFAESYIARYKWDYLKSFYLFTLLNLLHSQSQAMSESKQFMEDKKDSAEKQDERQYPPLKIVLPAMVAIWLAFFVVALVRNPFTISFFTI